MLPGYTVLGLIGTFLVVVAYLANQAGRLPSDDWRFPAANLLGSVLLLISLYWSWNLPSVVIEFFWGAISIFGLVRSAALRRRG